MALDFCTFSWIQILHSAGRYTDFINGQNKFNKLKILDILIEIQSKLIQVNKYRVKLLLQINWPFYRPWQMVCCSRPPDKLFKWNLDDNESSWWFVFFSILSLICLLIKDLRSWTFIIFNMFQQICQIQTADKIVLKLVLLFFCSLHYFSFQ